METTARLKIQTLKESLGPAVVQENALLRDDIYLLLWLKAHRMNVNKTEVAIREGIKWREENNMENIHIEHLPKQLVTDIPLYADGVSKKGLPVAYYHAGEARFSRLMKVFGRDKIDRYWLQIAKDLERRVIAANKNRLSEVSEPLTVESAHTCIAIVDVAGFTLRHLPSIREIQTVLEIARECLKQFPITPDLCLFINVNKAFQIPLRLIQPVLQGLGFAIRIYGTDEGTWGEVLELVDREQIRAFQRRAATCSTVLKNVG